jgi:hypothetical protein
MKYMMMMNTSNEPYRILNWKPEALQAHIAFMKAFNEKLRKSGEWVTGEGLSGPDKAKLVRAGKDGKPVTDGVFPESKEFLAGYWIIDVESPERAYELAAEASMAPGADGEPLHMAIEVREVMSAPTSDS